MAAEWMPEAEVPQEIHPETTTEENHMAAEAESVGKHASGPPTEHSDPLSSTDTVSSRRRSSLTSVKRAQAPGHARNVRKSDHHQSGQPVMPKNSASNLPVPLDSQADPGERAKLLMNAYSSRKSFSARSSHYSPRCTDTPRKKALSAAGSSTNNMLVEETKEVLNTYEQTVIRLAAMFNEEKKIAEAKEAERQHLDEVLRDLKASSVAPAAQDGSPEQVTIAELKERVESLADEVDAAEKRSRVCEHMVERIRLSSKRNELKIKHLKVIHDRIAMDRDQAELNMHKAQAERLAAENKVFDMEAELENQRIVHPQELAGLRRVVEKRKAMLLQRSLWENRVQADIDAIQCAEREKDLRAKLVMSNFHSARAQMKHQTVKEKADEYEERLRRVEQSTGLRIDLRNVGEVVDLVMRQKKIKDLQVDKVRGEARREALAEELRELHAALWSLLNVPERSSKMLDELTGPLRWAEARAERAAREVEGQVALALKTKSWIRNLTEKLATVDMLVGNDRRSSGQQDTVPAPAAPPVTLNMTDDDLARSLESLENRLYRSLLIASAPADVEPARELKTPRTARQSVFPTPVASPRPNGRPISPRAFAPQGKAPVLARTLSSLVSKAEEGRNLVDSNQPTSLEGLDENVPGWRDASGNTPKRGPETAFNPPAEAIPISPRESSVGFAASVLPQDSERKPGSQSGTLKSSLRPKLAAVTSLLRPWSAKWNGADPSSLTPRTTTGRLTARQDPSKATKPPTPRALTSADESSQASSSRTTPEPNLQTGVLITDRALKTGLRLKPTVQDGPRPRVTLDLTQNEQFGAQETTGKGRREMEAGGSRRRPATAHPILQAATNQLQMLKPEQLEALVLGQSTPRDVALDLLSRPGGNNWRLDQKIRNLKECFMTGPTSDDPDDGRALARSRSTRVLPNSLGGIAKGREKQVLDDEKEVVLEREDIKQQSAKIMDLLKLANKKWEDDEKAAEGVEREAPPLDVQDKRAKMVERLARPKRAIN